MSSIEPSGEILSLAREQGLTPEELQNICQRLGRVPNPLEVSLFAVMWSEHCSYKSSRTHLKRLPTKSPRVLQGPGENAGIIDIGEGLAIVFKIESHNHPSYIEPFQGAATGVGGILRDIFTMGARPVAIMDVLQFGDRQHPKTPYLLDGVVAGIASYGNCMGIPTIGGMTSFHKSYDDNILVNAFCLGIAEKERLFFGKASGAGKPVIYLGSRTGRDGIHGATMASDAFGEGTEEKRPTVQVGDPFTEKLVMEACLEIMREGLVDGIQDMGAAGLTCSTFEMSARGNAGIDLELDQVPLRADGMTPYEIMLSESQERMLLVCDDEQVAGVTKIAEKWGLSAKLVGRVNDNEVVSVRHNGQAVASLPAKYLTDEAPLYKRPMAEEKVAMPTGEELLQKIAPVKDWPKTIKNFLSHPENACKDWVTRQYDSMVGTDTISKPMADAAVLRIKDSQRGLAMSADVNHIFCRYFPKEGTKQAAAEAARNLYCSGAYPVGTTNCLNFGNPEKPHIMWQFSQAVDGLSEAASFFEAPVVSGNVSFYNETENTNIDPMPVIVMVGLLDDLDKRLDIAFKSAGDSICLLGETVESEIGLSNYLRVIQDLEEGQMPEVDLAKEKGLGQCLLEAADKKLLQSAHDIADGGLLLNLFESAFAAPHELGFGLGKPAAKRTDAWLFSESQARAVVTVKSEQLDQVKKIAAKHKVPMQEIGQVVQDRCEVESVFSLPRKQALADWHTALPYGTRK